MSTALAPRASIGPDNQYVTFAVAGEMFAVPIAPVQEIIRMPAVSQLPLAPAALDGLANLRGRVLPIVNLRRLLGCEERASDDATRALVIQLGQPLGFVVDRVASVVTIEPAEIEPADGLQGLLHADYLTGVIKRPRVDGNGEELLLAIDFARLIEGRLGPAGLSVQAAPKESAVVHADDGNDGSDGSAGDDADEGPDDPTQVVIFRLGAEEFGVPIMSVQEIVRVPEALTRVPQAPAFVEGVINLRGTVLPVIDQRARLGLPPIARHDGQRIMVYLLAGRRTGFIVDSVAEVLRIPRAQIVPAPGMAAAQSRLISEVAKLDGDRRLVMLIDPAHLLQGPEAEAIAGLGSP